MSWQGSARTSSEGHTRDIEAGARKQRPEKQRVVPAAPLLVLLQRALPQPWRPITMMPSSIYPEASRLAVASLYTMGT